MSGASEGHYLGVDAVFQYSGVGAQIVSGSIFYLIAVRMFSPTAVGAIVMFVAIVGLFNTIFSFGLGSAAQHFTSYSIGTGDYASVKKTVYSIITYGFALSISGFLALYILSPDISLIFLHTSSYTTLIRLLGFVMLGNVLFGVMNGALLGSQSFRLSAVISIIIWAIYYIGAIGLAIIFRSLSTVILGWAVGIFAGVVIELIAIVQIMRKYESGKYKKNANMVFAYSLPILLSSLISYGAGYADRFVVTGLTSLQNLGIYNFALLIASSIGFISVPFNNILMPKFSELFGRNRRDEIAENVKASSLLLTSLYVPAALGIAALAPSRPNGGISSREKKTFAVRAPALVYTNNLVLLMDAIACERIFWLTKIAEKNMIMINAPDPSSYGELPPRSSNMEGARAAIPRAVGTYNEVSRRDDALTFSAISSRRFRPKSSENFGMRILLNGAAIKPMDEAMRSAKL